MSITKRRIERIKRAITEKPYVFYLIGIFLVYIALNLVINKLYVNIDIFTSFALWFIIPFLLFNFLIIPALVALTINLSIIKFKEMRPVGSKGSGGFGFIGLFGGILGGACPGCFVGLFPAVLGLFGITASLSVLPLFGLEIQFLSAAFLITAIILLTRDTVCKIDIKKYNG